MPPPPKAKLHNKTGKLKTIGQNGNYSSNLPQNSSSSNSSNHNAEQSDTQTLGNSEADCQFELELCWCIQQLEISLNAGKLNEKQAQSTEKTLKILKSSNQPLIKKRQLMRTTFGDYRAKMNEEEKKLALGAKQIKFDTNAKQNDKSYFIKKSVFMKADKDFKFNFELAQGIEDLKLSNGNNKEKTNDSAIKSEFNFAPSGNSFKFNFNLE